MRISICNAHPLAGVLLGLSVGLSNAAHADSGTVAGDAERGKTLYGGCQGCHSLDDNDVGPKHRGVVGRTAGSVSGYAYSPALKASGLVWTPALLDRWLTNPQTLVPGAKMFYSIADAKTRADIIAYLATQK